MPYIDPRTGKQRRGFASMAPAKRVAIAKKGGASVNPANRSFSKDRQLAADAGRKGGQASRGGGRPAKEPEPVKHGLRALYDQSLADWRANPTDVEAAKAMAGLLGAGFQAGIIGRDEAKEVALEVARVGVDHGPMSDRAKAVAHNIVETAVHNDAAALPPVTLIPAHTLEEIADTVEREGLTLDEVNIVAEEVIPGGAMVAVLRKPDAVGKAEGNA